MINTKKLIQELSNLEEGGIDLIETGPSKIIDAHLAAEMWISEKNYLQIILSVTRPCKNLLNLYKKNNIGINKTIILCTCCQEKEIKKYESSNVMHIQSSSSLTEISLALSKCIQSIKGKKIVLVDSLSTLLIHNDPNMLAKFIHFILTKIRINNVPGLLFTLESETNKEVKVEIEQLCDKIIKV